MNRLFLFCAFLSLFYRFADAFSAGAPDEVCKTMAPDVNRHEAVPQDSTPPYMIHVDKQYYNESSKIKVTVNATGGATIKGILIQARNIGKDKPLGRFTMIPQMTKYLDCTSYDAEHEVRIHRMR